MPDNILGGQGATLLTAIIIVAVALLALVGVFWLIRNRAASTFIRGGKNRQPRLAVLDATAVDTRRRLVLIRRDDVEHLVMIGGPTDVVIESRIVHADQGRVAQQPDQAGVTQAPAREPRAPQPAPAPRPSAPQQPRAPAPAPSVITSMERTVRHAETASQPPVSAPSPAPAAAAAAAIATAGAASSIRTEAADLLDSARTRVFEEPSFDDSALDDLMATPLSDVQEAPAAAPARPAPQQSPSPSPRAPAVAAKADPIQAEAANVLETIRTRVFEEPSFDESAFDELTAEPAAHEQTRSPAPAPRPTAPAADSIKPAAPAASDFEAVLAAELSQDLTHNAPNDSLITAHYNEHQLDPDEAELLEAPDVKPEPQPSRDSLEAEMEKLLGDLSRKP